MFGSKKVKTFEQSQVSPEATPVPDNQETQVEQVLEQASETAQERVSEIVQAAALPTTDDLTATQVVKTEIKLEKVESILADNLDTIFLDMDAAQQAQFKVKGEETARRITILLNSTKATAAKIIGLIIDWLRLIPRVNKHFLEQEAKIKADRIIDLYKN